MIKLERITAKEKIKLVDGMLKYVKKYANSEKDISKSVQLCKWELIHFIKDRMIESGE